MTILTALDRDLFQKFLADAFAVQESGMDTHSLCTVVQVQRLMDTVPFDVDRAMNLIAEGASNIAHADGIAIARLEANQLAYRVGAGCAATYPGRRVPAVFTLSSHQDPRQEILRVENTQTDKRIEAAICKQFGAISLLILPVYLRHELTGILQVFFTQEHAFQEREVNAYRLMAGLVGEVIARESQGPRRKAAGTPEDLRSTTYRSNDHSPMSPAPSNYPQNSAAKVWSQMGRKSAVAAATQLKPSYLTIKAMTINSQPLKQVQQRASQWRIAVAAIVIAFVATWTAHKHTLRESMFPQKSATRESSLTYQPGLEHHSPRSQSAGVATTENKKPHNRAPILRGGTDYVASDVTIRHFTPQRLPLQVQTSFNEVTIGDDVTVRSFTYIPAITSAKERVSGPVQ